MCVNVSIWSIFHTTPYHTTPLVFHHHNGDKTFVIFDAFARCLHILSLNHCCVQDIKSQQDFVNIFSQFCVHIIEFTANIYKMYWPIIVLLEYGKLQNILWRSFTTIKTITYWLNIVSFLTTRYEFLNTLLLVTVTILPINLTRCFNRRTSRHLHRHKFCIRVHASLNYLNIYF